MIYLDSAATSYYRPPCVKEAVAEAIDSFGNPSRGAYGSSLDADRCLFETRLRLASLFGADGPDCVAYTMNATHALNEALYGLDLKPGDHLIISLQEHNSVLRPAFRLRDSGVQVHIAGLHKDGTFDIDDYRSILEKIPKGQRIVTALAHGSNVTGNVIDLKAVSRLCRTYHSVLIIDAAQTAGIIPVDMKKDGIDILCVSGHKGLMGPQGTGAILVRRGLELKTLMEGGSGIKTYLEAMPPAMPAHLEAGTQNAHSIAGLGAALAFAEGKREGFRQKEMELKALFLEGIRMIDREYGTETRAAREEAVHVYGDPWAEESLPTIAFNVRGYEAGKVADLLWQKKEIAVRAGGHCAPLIHRFFGTEKRGIVRVSFSHYNTGKQVEILTDTLRDIVNGI